MKIGKEAPELTEIVGWINSDATSLHEQCGATVILFFWDHTCLGCIQAVPFMTRLAAHYRNDGLKVIGVHSAEFEFAKQMDNLDMAIRRLGISFPVAQDERNASWLTYGNRFLPKMFIIDSKGILVHEHIGIGNERGVEQELRDTMGIAADDVPPPLWALPGKKMGAWQDVTPATYLGFKEILSIGRNAALKQSKDLFYNDTGDHTAYNVYLRGAWKQYDRFIEHEGDEESHVLIACTAQRAYVVMSAPYMPIKAFVHLDGAPVPIHMAGTDIAWGDDGQSYVLVQYGRIYQLISLAACEYHEISIHTNEPHLQLYNFQFE